MKPFQRRLEAGPPQAQDRSLGLLLALADDREPRRAAPSSLARRQARTSWRALVISNASGPPSGGAGLTPRLTAIQS